MQPADQPQWYFTHRGDQHGPVTPAELRKLVELGHLTAADYVWREGFANWVTVGEIPELSPHRPPPPPPPQFHVPAAPGLGAAYADAMPASVAEVTARLAGRDDGLPRDPAILASQSDAGFAPGGGAHRAPRFQAAQRQGVIVSAGPAGDDGTTALAGTQSAETTTALIAYILLVIPVFVLPLIGLIIALVNRAAAPEWLATHYRWQIRTFLIGLLYAVVGSLLSVVVVGLLILVFTFIWLVVRVVKGISALNRREPIANVATWLW